MPRTKDEIDRIGTVRRAMRKPMPHFGLYQSHDGTWHIGEDNDLACRMIGRVWSEEDGKAILLAMGKRIKSAKRKR